jgi:hypothetical protein
MNLQMAGFSERDISELTAVVNTRNKMGSLGLSQGNGHGAKKLDTGLVT